jgi:hypothetical protein
VRHAARREHDRPCRGCERRVVSDVERQLPVEHHERLVVDVVNVQRRHVALRRCRLDDAEPIVGLRAGELDDRKVVEEPAGLAVAGAKRLHPGSVDHAGRRDGHRSSS